MEDRDPMLQALFAEAEQQHSDEDFVTQVMAKVDQQVRWRRIRWVCLYAILIVLAWMLAEPIQELVYLALPWLTQPLIEAPSAALNQWLLPVNNLATVLALSGMLLYKSYRRLF